VLVPAGFFVAQVDGAKITADLARPHGTLITNRAIPVLACVPEFCRLRVCFRPAFCGLRVGFRQAKSAFLFLALALSNEMNQASGHKISLS
jgi:hypothetical protein